jgi:ribonucleoside-diphosphate reductase alpha chain
MGKIEDSISSIFDNIKEGALTMQWGGGIGYDFSTLRPKGTLARSTNNISSGPVSFMKIWDAMCDTMMSTGARRGAMMGTLRCDHPDIMDFIRAKEEPGVLTNFNISVLISDAFMQAVERDDDWPLLFPSAEIQSASNENSSKAFRKWNGSDQKVPCRIFDILKARHIWEAIMRSTYEHAEPGVLFIDRINEFNNLGYTEQIHCTNPCGEVPLPYYGSCNLGSVNLTAFIKNPFTDAAEIDIPRIKETVEIAVRMLDNVTTISRFPLDIQKKQALKSRRMGIGITGLADALIMLNQVYSSVIGRNTAEGIMREICHAAYRSSIMLALEKGSFPDFDRKEYTKRPFIKNLPVNIQTDLKKYGIRNSHLLSIAPTGSISLLAGNVSSGLEPIFNIEYTRGVLNRDGSITNYRVQDYAYRKWLNLSKSEEELPATFIKAMEMSPEQHLKMQAVLQPYVDNSISKTINVPKGIPFASFKKIYENAYHDGLKGCTTFRPNATTGSVMTTDEAINNKPCCSLEQEVTKP